MYNNKKLKKQKQTTKTKTTKKQQKNQKKNKKQKQKTKKLTKHTLRKCISVIISFSFRGRYFISFTQSIYHKGKKKKELSLI